MEKNSPKKIRENLPLLFQPSVVAVVGASEKMSKLGCHVMKSLTQEGSTVEIVPVNPGAKEVMGLRAYPSLLDFDGPVDAAVIVVPAHLVAEVLEQCSRKGVKGVVLITAGFREIDDPAGGDLQDKIESIASDAGIPVIGPNTFGIVNRIADFNASFTPEFSTAPKGRVALVSQSGGISHLLAFLAMYQKLGISKIIGLGNRLNVDFADIIYFLMDDPDTAVIALYLEGVESPGELMQEAAACRGRKPIVALKAGKAKIGDAASLSHTGTMAGNQKIYEGAFRQAGILGVDSTQSLLDMARALSICSVPAGPRVAVLTAQAGPGMAACDVCEDSGLEIVSFSRKTQKRINELLPPMALRTNPVDMGPAWYSSAAISGIIEAVLEDRQVDAVLLLMMFASANRDALAGISGFLDQWNQRKPVVGCIVSPPGVWDNEVEDMEKAGAMVNLPTPERAAEVMAGLLRYKGLLHTK